MQPLKWHKEVTKISIQHSLMANPSSLCPEKGVGSGRFCCDAQGLRCFEGAQHFVIRIPLDRGETRTADDGLDFFRSGGALVAGLLQDIFFHQDTAEVVRAGQQPQLYQESERVHNQNPRGPRARDRPRTKWNTA